MKKILLYFMIFVFIISNIFCINSYATEEQPENAEIVEQPQETEKIEQIQAIEEYCTAEVKKIGEIRDDEEASNAKIQEVTLEILNGSYENKEVTANYVISNKDNYEKYKLEVGDEVEAIISGDVQGNLFVTIQNLHRNTYIILSLAILLIAIFLLYGKHCVKALLSSILTLLLIYFVLFEQIANGHNCISVTILFGILLTIIESIINNGLNKKIWISLFGTSGGVLVSAILSIIFMHLTRININIENQIQADINYYSLIISGVIVVSFGVCMNLAMYIICNLDNDKNETKDVLMKDLFKIGIKHGKEQIMKFVNILIIAFVGINLCLIITYGGNYDKFFDALSQDYIVVGVISIVLSCVGIIASVPIISIFYALINSKKTRYKTTSENKVDGKRSLKI